MKVLVTGAAGFTGSYAVPLFLDNGFDIRCLVRKTSNTISLNKNDVELVYGDLEDISSLKHALEDIDAMVNIASMGFGHGPNVVRACVETGVKRAIFVSTTAIFTRLNAASKSIRIAAENIVRNSGLDYTILRPTMIYGSSRDRNICRLIRYLERWPIIPVFGDGECLQQPVYVKDVAKALHKALVTRRTIKKSYNIAGGRALSLNQMIDTICGILGRRVQKIKIPISPVVKSLSFAETLSLSLPIKAEQVLRLNEDKAFDTNEAERDFEYEPYSFVEGVTLEIKEMGIDCKNRISKDKSHTI